MVGRLSNALCWCHCVSEKIRWDGIKVAHGTMPFWYDDNGAKWPRERGTASKGKVVHGILDPT
jgi:hypothetical protein